MGSGIGGDASPPEDFQGGRFLGEKRLASISIIQCWPICSCLKNDSVIELICVVDRYSTCNNKVRIAQCRIASSGE